MRGRDKFKKIKPAINIIVCCLKVFPIAIRVKLLAFFRTTKGNKGLVARYCFFKSIAKNCGDNVSIHPDVYLLAPERLEIGNNVSIHPMCYIDATGGIFIGDNVSIAHGVTIMSTSHIYDCKDVPIADQGVVLGSVLLEGNIWIGAKATIVAGRTVSKGSVIAANTVITKDFESNSVLGGVPAKVLKLR